MPKLVITDGEGTREVGLNNGDTLGRTSQNAIQLKVAEASRTHCKFTHEKGAWFVEDQGSSNGTQVNGRRVTKFELQDGDVIQIGKVELRFFDVALTEAAPVATPSSWGSDDLSLEEKVFLVLGVAGRRGEILELPEGKISVGRNMKHALVIKDASVSGDHAEIRREGTTCTIKDLDSSNGTFVNGERVHETDLSSGDAVRFGTIECTFGVGDPKDFAPPAPVEVTAQSSDEFTKLMPMPAMDEGSSSFDLHAVPARKDTLWNVVSAVVILALGGAVAWLVLKTKDEGAASGPRALERGSNLLAEGLWSFELPETEAAAANGWTKERLDDDAGMGEVSDPRRSGQLAYRISRGDPNARPGFAVLNDRVVVTPGAAYDLSAWVSGDGAIPMLAAIWYEEHREGEEVVLAEVTRDHITGKGAGTAWERIGGTVYAPDEADVVLVAVGAAGAGSVVFDDASLLTQEAPAGSVLEKAGFKAVLKAAGSVRLSRFGRRVIDGIGIAAQEHGRWLFQPELLVIDGGKAKGGSVEGTVRGDRGDLRVTLGEHQDEFQVRYAGPGLSGAGTLAFPLLGRENAEPQVTLLAGDSAHSFSRPFEAEKATALIIGTGFDRAKVHLRDGAGQPLELMVRWEAGGPLPAALVDVKGRSEVVLDVQLSFADEEKEARELIANANRAVREKRGGDALKACERIMARFPFEAKIVEEAQRIQSGVQGEARARVEALRTRMDDAVFFRDLGREAKLRTDVADERTRYAGTPIGEEFGRLEESLQAALRAWEQPRREAEASRLLQRGQDFMDGGKPVLASLLFRSVKQGYAGTDEAEQAQKLLERLKGGGETPPKER